MAVRAGPVWGFLTSAVSSKSGFWLGGGVASAFCESSRVPSRSHANVLRAFRPAPSLS